MINTSDLIATAIIIYKKNPTFWKIVIWVILFWSMMFIVGLISGAVEEII